MSDQQPNSKPYTAIAGELIADAIALLLKVQERHPGLDVTAAGMIVNVDLSTKLITVGFRLADDSVLLAEQIRIDNDPVTFGAVVTREPASASGRTH